MKIKKYSSLLTFIVPIILINSCSHKRDISFFSNNKNSILTIITTGYEYKDYSIFKIGAKADITKYSGFLNYSYLATKDHTIYTVSIDTGCTKKYIKGNYNIDSKDAMIDSLNPPNLCDIHFDYFFNTDISIADTISVIEPNFDWVILKTKFFDTHINDTVYIYEKKVHSNKYLGFSFCYSQGFIGLYALKHYQNNKLALENAYGKIYEDKLKKLYPSATITYADSLPIIFKDVDLPLIKEFKKYN